MKNNDNLETEIGLGMLMSQVDRLCTKRFIQNSHKLGLDISQDQWMVLGPIWKQEGISQKEIAEYCGKDKTSVTKIIDTLEKKNFLVRFPDQIDQRVKRVVLSNKGKKLMNDVMPVIEQTRNELRVGISDREIDMLKSILGKIYNNLKSI